MRFDVTHTDVRSEKLHIPITVVQISDLHDAKFGESQARLIEAICTEKPDLIACTGDLFNRKDASAYQNVFDLIERLVPVAPVYAVEGNHEISLGKAGERYMDMLRQKGVMLLRNEAVTLSGIRLIGLKQKEEKAALAALTEKSAFNLVLCHRPELFSMYCTTDADLILCGHAHGGQVRFGSVSLYAPQQGIFPRFTSGLYEQSGTRMYVSRGLGNTIPFPRVFNRPELAVLRLLPKAYVVKGSNEA